MPSVIGPGSQPPFPVPGQPLYPTLPALSPGAQPRPPPGTLLRPPPPGTMLRPPPPGMVRYGPPPPPLPPGTLLRPGRPGPPPGAPGGPFMPPVIPVPPAPGGPPDPTFGTMVPPRRPGAPHVPLAKCRVLYLGSAVPTETAVGQEAVQGPLRERYPTGGKTRMSGIDAWITVFSSGILMQYLGDNAAVTWFPIHTLHVCAAVKSVVHGGVSGSAEQRFVPLDSPAARSSNHPPIFAAIMRRTKGVKVLECHAFICKSEQAALALVQGCTHAYEHKEGWVESEPPKELYQIMEAMVDPDDPNTAVGSEDQLSDSRPPREGYFYSSRDDLVKSFNVYQPGQERMQPASQSQLATVVPPAHPPRAGGAVLPAPPPGYFADWDVGAGRPLMVFPGPYVSDEEYERNWRRKRSPERRKPRSTEHSRHQEYIDYPEPVNHRPRRARSPQGGDYYDEYGNRYYRGRRENDYGYRTEFPKTLERREYRDKHVDDLILYAPRYQRHIEAREPRGLRRERYHSPSREDRHRHAHADDYHGDGHRRERDDDHHAVHEDIHRMTLEDDRVIHEDRHIDYGGNFFMSDRDAPRREERRGRDPQYHDLIDSLGYIP